MELLNYPKTDYLLDAALESLHAQSVEWLNELAFRSDEMTFFYHILRHKSLSTAFPASQVAEIEKELVRLNGDELDKLKMMVVSHERSLAAIFKTASLADEQVYRETHKKLLGDLLALHQDIRNFKKKLFSIIEK